MSLNGYKLKRELGQGSYATVYLAVEEAKPSRKVAIKQINKGMMVERGVESNMRSMSETKKACKKVGISTVRGGSYYEEVPLVELKRKLELRLVNKRIDTEVKLHKKVFQNSPKGHPCRIVELFETFEEDENVYLVLEYCSGGDLKNHYEKMILSLEEIKIYFQQIVEAVSVCHEAHVAHRDLKPENFLLDGSGNIKLTDFGLAAEIRGGVLMKAKCGTPLFVAPEVMNYQRGGGYVGSLADIWSLGIILFELINSNGRISEDREYEIKVGIARRLAAEMDKSQGGKKGQAHLAAIDTSEAERGGDLSPSDMEFLRAVEHELPVEIWDQCIMAFANQPTTNRLQREASDLLKKILVLIPDERPSLASILEHEWFTNKGRATGAEPEPESEPEESADDEAARTRSERLARLTRAGRHPTVQVGT